MLPCSSAPCSASPVDRPELLFVLRRIDAVDPHRTADDEARGAHSRANLGEVGGEVMKPAKRCRRIDEPWRSFAADQRLEVFGNDCVAGDDHLVSRESELLHQRLRLPAADAEDQVDGRHEMLRLEDRYDRGVTVDRDRDFERSMEKRLIVRVGRKIHAQACTKVQPERHPLADAHEHIDRLPGAPGAQPIEGAVPNIVEHGLAGSVGEDDDLVSSQPRELFGDADERGFRAAERAFGERVPVKRQTGVDENDAHARIVPRFSCSFRNATRQSGKGWQNA